MMKFTERPELILKNIKQDRQAVHCVRSRLKHEPGALQAPENTVIHFIIWKITSGGTKSHHVELLSLCLEKKQNFVH